MQELLGRIMRLDPSASLGLRVIACFDELVIGNVNTRALLASAASLAGCVAGFSQDRPARTVRVAPDGHLLDGPAAVSCAELTTSTCDDLSIWLERVGALQPNDTIILERLSLAIRIRHGRGRREFDNRRDLGLLVDESTGPEEQGVAAAALGLSPDSHYRVVVAPLFALWAEHPSGPEDVVPTAFGPLHALVLPEQTTTVDATPCGIGVAAGIGELHHSFRTAVVALRLCELPEVGQVNADELGGLAGLLADSHGCAPQPDAERLAELVRHPWGPATVAAIVRSGSVRQAARAAGVHHSTMQSRVDTITEGLGFDPFEGFGRTRLGTAHLLWRLRTSRVLDLPPPG